MARSASPAVPNMPSVSLLTTVVDGDPAKPTLFLVEKGTPGFNIRRLPEFAQRSGHGHPEVDIVNMRLPATQILGEVGAGFRAHQGLVRRGAPGDRRAQHRHGRPRHRACQRLGRRARTVRPQDHRVPGDRVHDRRNGDRHHGGQVDALPGRRRDRRRARAQAGACQGQRDQAVLLGSRLPRRRQGGADLRRARHDDRESGRAAVPATSAWSASGRARRRSRRS